MKAPKLRFKEFSDLWQPRLFEELYEFKNGLNKEKEAFGSGTPILNYMDVNKNTFIDIHDIKGKVNLTDSEVERFLVKNNDLFFTRTSETSDEIGLTCSYIGENTSLVFSGFVLKASPKIQKIDSTFYSYYLRTFNKRKEIIKHSSITTRALTSGTLLSSMPVNYTSIAEQKKIAKFLKKIDHKVELQQEKIDLLKEQKKGYMQKIFNQELRFKDENGEEFAEWKLSNLGEIAKIVGGGTPSTQNQSFWSGEIPWISSSDLSQDNYYDITFNRHINEYAINSSATHRIPSNSIAVVTRVGLGKIAYVTREYCTSQDFQNLIGFEENPIFLVHALAIELNKIITMSQGTSIKGITKKELESINIYLPSKEEQDKIGAFLKAIDNQIQSQQEKVNLLEKQKQAFLQHMFI